MNSRIKSYISWISVWVLLATAHHASSQSQAYKQYTEEDGLPSLTTYEIVQDSSGILWIGTSNGLVSYDGEKFEKYLFSEFQDNDILQTFIHETGDVGFVNLANEVGLIKGDSIAKFTFQHSTNTAIKIFQYEGRNFTPWEQGGFLRLKDGIASSDSSLSFLKLDKTGSNQKFILSLNDSDSKFLAHSLTDVPEIVYIQPEEDIIGSRINNSSQMSIYHILFPNGKKSHLLQKTENSFTMRTDFFKDKNPYLTGYFTKYQNKYLFISNNKVYSYDSSSKANTLISDDFIFQFLFLDTESILWVSTQNNGLIKFNDFNSSLEIVEIFKKEIIQLQKSQNALLVTTYDQGVLYDKKFKKRDQVLFRRKKESSSTCFKNKCIIINGNDIIHSTDFKFFSPSHYHDIAIKDILKIDDELYLGTRRGLIPDSKEKAPIYENGKRNEFIDLPNSRITKIELSNFKNDLFIGTTKGLYVKIDMGTPKLFCKELQNQIITSIYDLNDSTLLVGTENHGLFKLTNEKVDEIMNMEKGLLSNSINDFAINGDNMIIASDKGISLYNMRRDSIFNLTKFHGLPSNKVSSVLFQDESIIAGVGKSLMKLDLEDFKTTKNTSKLSLARFLNNNIEVDLTKNHQFTHNQNNIDIYFTHISQRSTGSEKSFKYRIKELDDKWVVIKEPSIRLPALQPGSYSIEALGLNEIGGESNKIALSFTITPPWWQTIGARILGVLSVLLVIYLVSKYRVEQFRKKEEVKRTYLTQINQIKDQALQLQMNPHFIFNSLNAIQNFIGTNEEEKAINYLARFAKMIRMIFEYSKGNKISLDQELEFINLYLNLEKLRFKDKVEIELIVDEEIDENRDVIKIPPLLIQPIVENSFKHGLFHKIGKGKLLIEYRLKGNLLTVMVEDNGIGREASKRRKNTELKEKTSSGLNTTNERLNILNFEIENSPNSIFVEDLKDVNNNSVGTRSTITLAIV